MQGRLHAKYSKDASQMPIFFKEDVLQANSGYFPHSHEWGQFVYVCKGVVTLNLNKHRLFALPNLGVWIPPYLEHSTFNTRAANTWYINLHQEYYDKLPKYPCAMHTSDIFKVIVTDIFARGITTPITEADHNLCTVLFDQLRVARVQANFLPKVKDDTLKPIIRAFEENPEDNTSVGEWAKRLHISERSLTRLFQNKTGLSFGDWRSYTRFHHALSLIDQDKAIEEIARSVGYKNVSSFIYIFKKITGISPTQYRELL